MPDETVIVYVKWVKFNSDPRQWKPSNPEFMPEDVSIAVPVPKELVYDKNGTETILTPAGMRYVIDVMESIMMATTKNDFDTYSDEDFK